MIGDEFKTIVMKGEFSEGLDILIGLDGNTSFTFGNQPMLFNDAKLGIFNEFLVHGIIKKGWKRSEIDGVLSTKLPRRAVTITMSRDSLPIITTNNDGLSDFLFRYDNTLWEIVYVIGVDLLSFMVTPKDDLLTDETIDDDNEEEIEAEYEDAPGLV